MGSHKSISGSTPRSIPPVPVPYHVSGILTPDCSGNYLLTGEHEGKPYYRRADGAFFIWWRAAEGSWYISDTVDLFDHGYWIREYIPIEGEYSEGFPYTGTATVSEGPQ